MFIVVLGGGIDLQGNLPLYIHQRLDKAIELYKTYPSSKLVLSGKYSFLYREKKPPLTEAHAMADYLRKKGVDKRQMLLENKSKDTIGNAYYLKKDFFIPFHEKKALIVTSEYHLTRVKYIFQKLFGPGYQLKYISIKEKLNPHESSRLYQHQKDLLLKTQNLFSKIKDGDHNFLKGKIYKFKYYREKRPNWVINFVTGGK